MNITKNKYKMRECVFGLIWNIGYAIFTINYYCSPLILNNFLCVDKLLLLYVMVKLETGGKVKGG